MKSAFQSLKWGFLHGTLRISSEYFRVLEIGFPAFKIALFRFRNAEINIKAWK